ncbi:hypothetical protein J7L60_03360, partial [Candidatus Bathyarchaeota archaeon]|nr:hypothetical protein [Candidatus Bathyarchaeota archaeon]
MWKMDIVVSPQERLRLSKVEGDLLIGDGGVVEVDGEELIVTGAVICRGDARIQGSVRAERLE